MQGAYYCTIEQLDLGVTTGAQGWQMIFTASGCDGIILAATATQTDVGPGTIEDCEAGLGGSGGFDATRIVRSVFDEAGAVHAIVLHLKKGTTLDPTGLNTEPAKGPEQNPAAVCRFLVEHAIPATGGQSCDMTLLYTNLNLGAQPFDNKIIQDGQSVIPEKLDKVVTHFAIPSFIRADSNVDGETDISDAVRTLMFLFQGASDPPCLSAADSNDDGYIDISDAIHTLNDLFIPGTAIPDPGPFACGPDPTPDGLTCIAFDLCP